MGARGARGSGGGGGGGGRGYGVPAGIWGGTMGKRGVCHSGEPSKGEESENEVRNYWGQGKKSKETAGREKWDHVCE